jgi:hypothetical protein
MVEQTTGILTSLNTGSLNGGLGERVLIDYKDAILDYRSTDLPVMGFFADPMSTDTGGNIDITFAKPSMAMEQLEEGTTPVYQHTKLRSERIAVKEWGLAIGVTRRMMEDSRFNEVEMALNEARKAVDRHLTQHVTNVVFGIGDAGLGTGLDLGAGAGFQSILAGAGVALGLESNVSDFTKCPNGGFLGTAATFAGRLDDYANQGVTALAAASGYTDNVTGLATSGVSLSDISAAITRMSLHGYNATHLFISPTHYENILKMADFTTVFNTGVAPAAAAPAVAGEVVNGGNVMPTSPDSNPFSSMLSTGGLVGQLYGLAVVVNPWVPTTRYGIFDLSVKPMAYVERRALTVEEANPGFGIVGSYMSMRYGLKIVRPEAGQIIIG